MELTMVRDIDALAVATDVTEYLANNPTSSIDDAISTVLADSSFSKEDQQDVTAFCKAIVEPNF
jgi:hypothetical protein